MQCQMFFNKLMQQGINLMIKVLNLNLGVRVSQNNFVNVI
jgi:hypothetical protein